MTPDRSSLARPGLSSTTPRPVAGAHLPPNHTGLPPATRRLEANRPAGRVTEQSDHSARPPGDHEACRDPSAGVCHENRPSLTPARTLGNQVTTIRRCTLH